MKTYETLIADAEAAITAFNSSADEADRVDFATFKAKLVKMGGTDVEALAELSWEDLRGLGITAPLQAKKIAKIFRQEGGTTTATTAPPEAKGGTDGGGSPWLSAKKAEQATELALVQHYDPKRPTSPVSVELKKRSGDKPFILFKDDGKVEVEVTTRLLEELVAGDPPRKDYHFGGRARPLYKVGERPAEFLDEHPLFPGQALRRDGTDDNGLAWGGLPLEVRQILYLAVTQTGELRITQGTQVHDTFDLASGEDGLAKVTRRYKQAQIKFDQLKGPGNLPTLKLAKTPASAGGTSGGGGGSSPFYGAASDHKRY